MKKLGLLSLSARRLRYRLIFLFKMFKGLIGISFSDFFVHTARPVRISPFRIRKHLSSRNFRSMFFTLEVRALEQFIR